MRESDPQMISLLTMCVCSPFACVPSSRDIHNTAIQRARTCEGPALVNIRGVPFRPVAHATVRVETSRPACLYHRNVRPDAVSDTKVRVAAAYALYPSLTALPVVRQPLARRPLSLPTPPSPGPSR